MRKKVLFACVGNAFRSQIAEAWALHFADPVKVEVRSGGTHPAGVIHRQVPVLLSERGLGVPPGGSKPIDLAFADSSDAFITLCGPVDDACPARIAKKAVDWNITDPSWSTMDEMRRVRDDIGRRVHKLLMDLEVLRREARPPA
jgi:arsenate reductase (thioredoxin)